MTTYFILISLKFKNQAKQRSAPDYWIKVLEKLSNGKATILYHCADTSADAFIRDHAEQLSSFTTYLLLPADLMKFDDNTLRDAVRKTISGNSTKNSIMRTDNYEVITCEEL